MLSTDLPKSTPLFRAEVGIGNGIRFHDEPSDCLPNHSLAATISCITITELQPMPSNNANKNQVRARLQFAGIYLLKLQWTQIFIIYSVCIAIKKHNFTYVKYVNYFVQSVDKGTG